MGRVRMTTLAYHPNPTMGFTDFRVGFQEFHGGVSGASGRAFREGLQERGFRYRFQGGVSGKCFRERFQVI